MRTMFSRIVIFASAAVAVAACGAHPDAKASSGSDSTHSAGGEVSKKPAETSTPSIAETPIDTANPRLIPGRKKMDSTSFMSAIRAGARAVPKWPSLPAADGALLPKNRIIAYYGNPHSRKMGVLGEYPEQEMLSKLDKTVEMW